MSRKRRTLVAALAAAVVATAGIVVYSATRPDPATPRTTPTPQPVVLAQPQPAVVTPTRPSVPHDAVAPAPPNRFEIKGSAFTIKADVCEMPYVRPLDPPGDQVHTVCWVRDSFGVAPGSDSGGTSYILGHSWAQAELVFNPLSEYAMREVDLARPTMRDGVKIYPVKRLDGYRITLRTRSGVLTYAVRGAFAVGKSDAASVRSVMATKIRNRVVLITCGVRNGVDVDVNVIVYAYLTSSRAA